MCTLPGLGRKLDIAAVQSLYYKGSWRFQRGEDFFSKVQITQLISDGPGARTDLSFILRIDDREHKAASFWRSALRDSPWEHVQTQWIGTERLAMLKDTEDCLKNGINLMYIQVGPHGNGSWIKPWGRTMWPEIISGPKAWVLHEKCRLW